MKWKFLLSYFTLDSALKASEHILMERVSKKTYKEERGMEKSGQKIIRRIWKGVRA